MNTGEKLIMLRGDRTQQQVADDLGISVAAVCAYENNIRRPRDEMKKEIAKYFNTSVEKLFF